MQRKKRKNTLKRGINIAKSGIKQFDNILTRSLLRAIGSKFLGGKRKVKAKKYNSYLMNNMKSHNQRLKDAMNGKFY